MYDEKCYDLAEYFLQDGDFTEAVMQALAQQIQDVCEDFINYDVELLKAEKAK